MQKGNTSNTVLVIVLVVIVAFAVWYMTAQTTGEPQPSSVELNLGSTDTSQ